jgi:hypothetical protein
MVGEGRRSGEQARGGNAGADRDGVEQGRSIGLDHG